MKDEKYNKQCADQVIRSLGNPTSTLFFKMVLLEIFIYVFRVGLDVLKIDKCIGDIEANTEKTIVINNR